MVDAGGSDRCALVGASLAMLAVKNGWAGLVLNGCVRDTAEIVEAELGIWAIATHPRRPEQKGSGSSTSSSIWRAFGSVRETGVMPTPMASS